MDVNSAVNRVRGVSRRFSRAREMGNPRTGSKKKNDGAESELHAAARAGNLRAVESICSSDPLAVNFRDKHSRTPAINKSKEVVSSAMWDKDATNIFCDLCLREVELGNRPKTYFNKEGWQNVMVKFKELTGRDYDRMKFKNKWDQLKKDWKIWKKLKIGTTGLGWNPVKRTIDAPEDWWTEKLEVMPAAKKFKFNGIDPVMEEKLDDMFREVIATGAHAFTPSEPDFIGTTDVLGTDNVSGSGEVPCEIQRNVESTSVSKRPRVEKRKKGVAVVKSTIEKPAESCTIKLVASHDISVEGCLRILNTHAEVKADRKLYINCVKLLQDPVRREFFVKLDAEYQVDFLCSFLKN